MTASSGESQAASVAYVSGRVPAWADASDLSVWLDVQDVTLSPETLTTVLKAVRDWLSTYADDVVDDVLPALDEDITKHAGPRSIADTEVSP